MKTLSIILMMFLIFLLNCGNPTSNNEEDNIQIKKFSLRIADTLKTGDGPGDWTYPYSYFTFGKGDTIGSIKGITRRYFLELVFENGKVELARDKKYIKSISVKNTEIATAEIKMMKMRYGNYYLIILIHGKKIGLTKIEINFSFGKHNFPLVIHPNITGKWLRYPGGENVYIWQIAAINRISQKINGLIAKEKWIFCDPNPSKNFKPFSRVPGHTYKIWLDNNGEIHENEFNQQGTLIKTLTYKRAP